MIEFFRRLERIHPMAISATGRERFLVIICMACQAFSIQSQESKIPGFDFVLRDKFRLVAILALLLSMRPEKFITCQFVVEIFSVKFNDPEISTMMLIVA